jgi:uncharacterized protein YerC
MSVGGFCWISAHPAELTAFAERWRVCQLLEAGGLSYREIHAQTGVSVTTIGRVARFLLQEPHQGYALALGRLKSRKRVRVNPERVDSPATTYLLLCH